MAFSQERNQSVIWSDYDFEGTVARLQAQQGDYEGLRAEVTVERVSDTQATYFVIFSGKWESAQSVVGTILATDDGVKVYIVQQPKIQYSRSRYIWSAVVLLPVCVAFVYMLAEQINPVVLMVSLVLWIIMVVLVWITMWRTQNDDRDFIPFIAQAVKQASPPP